MVPTANGHIPGFAPSTTGPVTDVPRPTAIRIKIVSGGQTGVDRAALDAAIAIGLDHGGWCPAGRLAEDGTVPSRYQLVETATSDYAFRTEQNVLDSDATLILYEGRLRGGTLLTRKLCERWQKPYLLVHLADDPPAAACRWLAETAPRTLNVAGPRESSAPGIEDRARRFLIRLLERRIVSDP